MSCLLQYGIIHVHTQKYSTWTGALLKRKRRVNFRVPEAATGDNYVAEMPISFMLGSPAGEQLRAALSTASARTPGRVPCRKRKKWNAMETNLNKEIIRTIATNLRKRAMRPQQLEPLSGIDLFPQHWFFVRLLTSLQKWQMSNKVPSAYMVVPRKSYFLRTQPGLFGVFNSIVPGRILCGVVIVVEVYVHVERGSAVWKKARTMHGRPNNTWAFEIK